jgi:hypothetical protein
MRRSLWMVWLILTSLAWAQTELKTGKDYPAGSGLRNSYFGISLKIPSGATGQFSDQQGVQVLAIGRADAALLLFFQHGVTLETYSRGLVQEVSLDTLQLTPTGSLKKTTGRVSIEVSEAGGTVGVLAAVVGSTRSSVLLVALAATITPAQKLLDAVLASLKFGSPLAGTGATNARQTWSNRLAGKRFSNDSTTSSPSQNGAAFGSSTTQITFCPNQTFQYASQSQASVGIPGGDSSTSTSESAFEGRWQIEYVQAGGAVVALTDTWGLQLRWPLTWQNNRVYISGQVYTAQTIHCP